MSLFKKDIDQNLQAITESLEVQTKKKIDKFQIEFQDQVFQKLTADNITLRQWVNKSTDEKIKVCEKTQALLLDKKVHQIIELFNV